MNPRFTIDSGAGGSANVSRRDEPTASESSPAESSASSRPSSASSRPSSASSRPSSRAESSASSRASSTSSPLTDLIRRTNPPSTQPQDFEHEDLMANHSEHLERAKTPEGFDGKYHLYLGLDLGF